MRKLLFVLLFSVGLSGCDFVEDMKDMTAQQEKLELAIKRDLDWNVEIGWHVTNGVFTDITVTLDANELRDLSVKEVNGTIRELVVESFNLLTTVNDENKRTATEHIYVKVSDG
jgi:hypothetical protein